MHGGPIEDAHIVYSSDKDMFYLVRAANIKNEKKISHQGVTPGEGFLFLVFGLDKRNENGGVGSS